MLDILKRVAITFLGMTLFLGLCAEFGDQSERVTQVQQ